MFYETPSSWGWDSDAYWEDEGREEGVEEEECSFLSPKGKKLSPFSDSPSPYPDPSLHQGDYEEPF